MASQQLSSAEHYELGKQYYQNKKFQEAIHEFGEAIRLKPESNQAAARCYNARGVVYFYLGEFKKVIKDCTKALEMEPENANYHNCRGNAYFSLGKFSKAAEDFSKAIELSPEASHGRYYNNRGSAYRRLKMFREAVEDYTAAIKLDPKNGNYHNNRGNTYFDMGEYQLAIDDFTKALGMEPYSPKTKVTLQQAQEALAQERRMKNSTQYQGSFSNLKDKGKELKRKERPSCNIYVSPMGIEITYTSGFIKKKAQVAFPWSEDMKIEILDDQRVKLFLDQAQTAWAIIAPCDAIAVEEELIGRITNKFASYSTACLVAQHEAVVKEYTDIVHRIKDYQTQLNLYQTILEEALKQVQGFVDQGKPEHADKAREQVKKLEAQVREKKAQIEEETRRAESVRSKAEQESGPVLDMVIIMQNRIRELYNTRVRGLPKDQVKPEDQDLEGQLAKMDAIAQRAQELNILIARPIQEIQRAMAVHEEEDAAAADEAKDDAASAAQPVPEGNDYVPEGATRTIAKAATPAPAPTPTAPNTAASKTSTSTPAPASSAAIATSTSASSVESSKPSSAAVPTRASSGSISQTRKGDKKEDSDESDWDDIDEDALPAQFRPSDTEIMMSVETVGGMVQIREKSNGDFTMVRKSSLMEMKNLMNSSDSKIKEIAALKEKEKESAQTLGQMKQQLDAANKEKESNAAQLKKMEDDLARLETLVQSKETTDVANRARNEEAASKLRSEVQAKEFAMKQENTKLASLQSEYEKALETIEEQERTVSDLRAQTENLDRLRRDAEDTKKSLAEKVAVLEAETKSLSKQRQLSAKEKEEKEAVLAAQREEIERTRLDLRNLNDDLQHSAQQTALLLAKQREYEENAIIMAQQQEQLKNATEEEKKRLAADKKKLEDDVTRLSDIVHDIGEEKKRSDAEAAQARKQIESLSKQQASAEMTINEMRKHLTKLQQELSAANEEKKVKDAEVVAKKEEIDKLNEQARQDELKRRELHNLIQEIKGNIRVYVKIRPNLNSENKDHKTFDPIVESDGRGIRVTGAEEESATGRGATKKTWDFEFDRIFWDNSTQGDVFAEISQLVQSALDGYKVCIFAYGQTGSGKTYTMEGPPNANADTEGMIPRAVTQIFGHIQELKKKGWSYDCTASFLEIYNQNIRDLLGDGRDVENDDHEIKMVKEGKVNKTIVTNLTQIKVKSREDLAPLLKKASSNRSVGATMVNERSSRSHSVFTLNLTGTNQASGQVADGVLNLIDLAGSERLDKSQATGIRLEETKAINTSLTCLGDVIAALANGSKFIPFRNSKLTFLLQDCFGGGSKTLMFINLAPELEHLQESLCSLRFGAKVHECHVGQAKKNIKATETLGGTPLSPQPPAAAKKPVAVKK